MKKGVWARTKHASAHRHERNCCLQRQLRLAIQWRRLQVYARQAALAQHLRRAWTYGSAWVLGPHQGEGSGSTPAGLRPAPAVGRICTIP